MTYIKKGVSSVTDKLNESVGTWIESGIESGKTKIRESLWKDKGAENGN